MTDSYTATDTVSATVNTTPLSEKTDGSPSETSYILADSGFSIGNVCDTPSIFCTSDFLEIPLNGPAMVKQVSNICNICLVIT